MPAHIQCATIGCALPAYTGSAYCVACSAIVKASALRDAAPTPDPMTALKPAWQAMVPGDRFTMNFYGRAHRFAFEAWEGNNVVARPSAQPWALVRIPLIDLVAFNAITTVEPL